MKAIVDCNSFYCSCERLFAPALADKPVVVLSNNDGCIVARTDEVKALGISMGAPYFMLRPLLEKHKVAVFSSNYNLYGDISWRIMETLRILHGTKNVEVYSVDEAFIDLNNTSNEKLYTIAKQIKETTEQWTGIKVSVGIASSKVLSKVANKLSKKNKKESGCIMVLDNPEKIKDALEKTEVGDLWGIGRQYASKLRNYGIYTAWQLKQLPEEWARKNLGGVVGVRMIKELNGIPCIPMIDPLETKKIIATTRMFGRPVFEKNEIKEAVATYVSRAAEKLRRQFSAAKMIQVFIIRKEKDNQAYSTRSAYQYTLLPAATSDTATLIKFALPLIDKIYLEGFRYIKAGVILSDIVPDNAIQENLFSKNSKVQNPLLLKAIDNINFSQRDHIIRYAATGTDQGWKMQQQYCSKRFTTRWDELCEIK